MKTIRISLPVSPEFRVGWWNREGRTHIIIEGEPSMEHIRRDMPFLAKSGGFISLGSRTIHIGSEATHWNNVRRGLACLLVGRPYDGMDCAPGTLGPFTGPIIEDSPRGKVLYNYVPSRRDGDGIPHDRRQVVVAAEEGAP